MSIISDFINSVHEKVVNSPATPSPATLTQQVATLTQQAALAQGTMQSQGPATSLQQRQIVPLINQAPGIPVAARQNPADQGMAVAIVDKGISMIKNSVATSIAVTRLIYNNAPDGTAAGAAVGYYAANYIPSFVTSTANSLVSFGLSWIPFGSTAANMLMNYAPQGVVGGAALGYVVAKIAPTIRARLAERYRQLPTTLTNKGLAKTDIPAALAKKIATLPAARQTAIAVALSTLKTAGLLKQAYFGVLLESKNPDGVARVICTLRKHTVNDPVNKQQYLDIWNKNSQALMKSENPLDLANTLVFFKDHFQAPQDHPLFTYPEARLTVIAASLDLLNQGGQLAGVLQFSGDALLVKEDPAALTDILVTLNNMGDANPQQTFAPIMKDLRLCPAAKLKSIDAALDNLVANGALISGVIPSIIISNDPLALSGIFVAHRKAGLLFTALTETSLCNPKRTDAKKLAQLATALETLPNLRDKDKLSQLFNAVLESDHPAILATSLNILIRANNIDLTPTVLEVLDDSPEEMGNAVILLNSKGIIHPETLTALMKSKDPQRMARALVKLVDLEKLNVPNIQALVAADKPGTSANALINMADELR